MLKSIVSAIRQANSPKSVNSLGDGGGTVVAPFDPATLDLAGVVHRWCDGVASWLYRKTVANSASLSNNTDPVKKVASDTLFDTGSALTFDYDWLYGSPVYAKTAQGLKLVSGSGDRAKKEPLPTNVDPRTTGYAFGLTLVATGATLTSGYFSFGDDGGPARRCIKINEGTAELTVALDAGSTLSYDLVDLTTVNSILVNGVPISGNDVEVTIYVNGVAVITGTLTCTAVISRIRDAYTPYEDMTIVRDVFIGKSLAGDELTGVLNYLQVGRPLRFGRFNRVDREDNVALTNDLLTGDFSGSWVSAKSTAPKLESCSFEVEFVSGSYLAIGVCTAPADVTTWLGGDVYGWSIMSHGYDAHAGATSSNGLPYSTGQKVLVVLDRLNDEVRWYIDGSTTADVVQDISSVSGEPMYFMVSGVNAVATVQTDGTLFTNTTDVTGWLEEV